MKHTSKTIAVLGTLFLLAGCDLNNTATTATPNPANTPIGSSGASVTVSDSATIPASSSDNSTPSTPSVKPAGKLKALCDSLNADTASGILGYAVTTGQGTLPTTSNITSCKYESTDHSKGYGVSIIANFDNNYQSAKEAYMDAVQAQKAGILSDKVTVNDVSDVGEGAVLVKTPGSGTMIAYKGSVWVTASMAYIGQTRTDDKLQQIVIAALNVL